VSRQGANAGDPHKRKRKRPPPSKAGVGDAVRKRNEGAGCGDSGALSLQAGGESRLGSTTAVSAIYFFSVSVGMLAPNILSRSRPRSPMASAMSSVLPAGKRLLVLGPLLAPGALCAYRHVPCLISFDCVAVFDFL